MVAILHEELKERNVQAVKKIFRYLKGITDISMWYPRKDSFTLNTYSYADWSGSVYHIKITSGGAFFLGESLVA
jgi:hypothetical protein